MFKGTPEKKPAESTLKARRRRKPIFLDEPIQWHLRTTRHDRCPWCGLQGLQRRGTRKRRCESCASDFEIRLSADEWMQHKLEGLPVDRLEPAHPRYFVVDKTDAYSLKDAQLRSKAGRATVGITHGNGFDTGQVYWHRDGHLPELVDGQRVCAARSEFHRWLLSLRSLKVWTPDESLNAMEVIARAYGTDDPMFAIMAS